MRPPIQPISVTTALVSCSPPLHKRMSAAQSDLVVEQSHLHTGTETPRHKAAPGSAIAELHIPTDKPLIAVDLDDVLSQTNRVVMECECSRSSM